MPLLAVAWAGFNTIAFQGYPDMFPVLPVVAFWAACFLHRLMERVPAWEPLARHGVRTLLSTALLILVGVYAVHDLRREAEAPTLERQRWIVRGIVGPPEALVMAFSAEEVYVLSERRSTLSREELEARLSREDLALLDAKVSAAGWYRIASYARMVELLAEVEAPGRTREYLIQRGAKAAERLAQSGIYQQLDASTERLGARVGNVVVTLGRLMYNFGSWRFEPGAVAGEFTVVMENAADFPEVARFATQGFVEFAATRIAGAPMRLESDRPIPDRIVYRGCRAG